MSRVCLSSLLSFLLFVVSAAGQPPKNSAPLLGITLPTDEDIGRRLKEINVLLDGEAYADAIDRLQTLLDRDDSLFASVARTRADGKTEKVTVNVRAEAARLIGTLPKAKLDLYRRTVAASATELLQKARKDNDPNLLTRILTRFPHTDASREALELLGMRHHADKHFGVAALCFERVADIDKLSALTLFKAAEAFQRSGDRPNFDRLWKALATKVGKAGLKVGDKELSLEELRKEIDKRAAPAARRSEWPLVGGNVARSAAAVGGPPLLVPLWEHSITTDRTIEKLLKDVDEHLDREKLPRLSALLPIHQPSSSAEDSYPMVVYRDFAGVHSRGLKVAPTIDSETKKPDWEAGDLVWEQQPKGSLEKLLKEPRSVGQVDSWLRSYMKSQGGRQPLRPQILFENSVVGCISSDDSHVYIIDDLQIPPPSSQFERRPIPTYPGDLGKQVRQSRLQAIHLYHGKIVWEAGYFDTKGDLEANHFLGAPLPLAGKLFVLAEKDQELRLLRLDPATGTLLAKPLKLGDLAEKITVDFKRRYQAAHLAYADGVLVCPTNSGAVFGVDLLTDQVLWTYGYREKEPEPVVKPGVPMGGPPGMVWNPQQGMWVPAPLTSNWLATPPILSAGKVVFTAPDANAVHCLNLRDGSLSWKHQRKDGDHYLAGVFNDKVLLVGKNYLRALNLTDGKQVYSLETGLPSGVGTFASGRYYLPLANFRQVQEPEICSIDIDKGVIIAHHRSRKKILLGNLLFAEGMLISQSPSSIVAFPLLAKHLQAIDQQLKKNDQDAEARLLRAEMRREHGDLKGTVEDALVARAGKLPEPQKARLQQVLYESLLEFLRQDFTAAEPHLKVFEELSQDGNVPQRRADYLIVVAQGRERQGQRVAAARLYLELAGRTGDKIVLPDDPALKVAPTVWAAKRLDALLQQATPAERKQIEKEMAERLNKKSEP